MNIRRTVRVTASFFKDLDRQLNPERGANGEPSAIDFQSIELVEIIDEFATGFDQLPRIIDSRDDYRLLIKAGLLVHAISVTAQLAPDGAVELLRLDIDLAFGWD